MSIIEEAVRKSAERLRRAPPVEPMLKSATVRRVRPAPVDASAARSFQQIELDETALAENNVLPQITDASALRAYKILRTRLLRRLEANQWRTLAVTGVTAGDGKTLTAINLAIALSQDVSTWVFLVDLDLHRPRIAEYMGMAGMHGARGLSDYLLGGATLDDITYSPNIERLAIIPNFQPVPNASELLNAPRMADLVQRLEAESPRRIVIFDMPPILAADDVLAFAPQIDGLLLVVGEGTTGRDALKSAKEVLDEMNLVGVVLNRSAERNDSAYYSYAKA
jgi:protein-tyrosine kinase